MFTQTDIYTTVHPKDLWKEFNHQDGLYRSGTPSHPSLNKLRLGIDVYTALDPFVADPLILPHPQMGISFADSLEQLKKIRAKGVPWVLPRGKLIPNGLVFNYAKKYHPLLNVSRPMSAANFLKLLDKLAAMMQPVNQSLEGKNTGVA